ncbi:TonB-linked SusC/RagA family outer membrane protein [Wenyingzhuangia heitensis]|uniref:TonB-linked SusC/RagA family outer membrane protein n=1 Tax=Wenyingzhuangia heitensis TaxID=1487859 RepID=A0ABX0U4X3_9FLAO|nr:TonB-dependent receptor [Wenyingzhuangia heitensis]NIJ43905.1 TonB-linked SusC/RagA family outer membrane protein [Wenyingzhuangia heitensis]
MKKKYNLRGHCHAFLKFDLKMKFSLLFLLITIFQIQAKTSYSQGKKITIEEKSATILQVIKKIEKTTDYNFFYSKEEIDMASKVTIFAYDEAIEKVLSKVFLNTEINFKVLEKQIVLTKKKLIKNVLAQEISIKGNVTDEFGMPVPGANVVVKGTTKGTITDFDGNFQLTISDTNAILVFSYVGYKDKEVAVNNQTVVNVVLQQDVSELESVVLVGYGKESRNEVTGAVMSIKSDDVVTQGTNTITRSLQGKVAGVQVESAGGNPGSGMRILIRGTGSLGNNDPLYIVDGVQVSDINNIAPTDIASMNILKDASAAAIYGSRAANGVVIITTKSGKKGETKINLTAYTGVQKVTKKLDVLNAEQWANVNNLAHTNAGLATLNLAQNPNSLGKGTDWQNEIYRIAPTQNYSLNISGGGENYNYSLSGSYLTQKGIVINTDYNRANLRFKSEVTKGRFKIGETVIISNGKTTGVLDGWGQGQGGNSAGSAAKMIPVFNVHDTNAIGGFAGAEGPVVTVINPVAQSSLIKPEETEKRTVINAYLEASIIKGLTYKFNVGYTNENTYNYYYVPPYEIGTFFTNLDADLKETRNETNTALLEHTLAYETKVGKSSIKGLLGYTYQNTKFRGLFGSKSGMPEGVKVLDAGTTNIQSGSNANENVLISYFGRLMYAYDNRYVVTGILRRDGSSRFGKSNRYGYFPSLSGAWNISNEDFFNKKGALNSAKFRVSYGVLGSQNFANYTYSPVINLNANYVMGQNQQLWPGAIQTAFASPDIKWEVSKTLNFGTDVGFFDNKLKVIADYFIKKNSDIILRVPIPLSTGASGSSPYVNAGNITNKGVEISASFANTVNDFSYEFNGSITAIKNRVDNLGTGTQQIFGGTATIHDAQTTITQAGGPVGAFHLIKEEGLFQTQQEIDNYTKDGNLIQPNAKPGDIKFQDYNNDGKIDQNDRQYLGSPTPDFSFGFGGNFAWKGFDMKLYFQGTHGNKIYNGLRQDLEGMDAEYNYATSTLNAWTPTNTNTSMPRAVINDPNRNDQTSSRFLEDGSYLRFKTFQLGYSFSDSVLKNLGLNNLRLYVSADNIFTITKYKGFNPDLGGTGSVLDRGVDFGSLAYPLSSTFLTGVQLSF